MAVDPITLSSIIYATSGFADQGLNARRGKKAEKREIEWQKAKYALQRKDNLADWDRVNEYNHPKQQMERLRQAGLNPHLVYGKGADTTAMSINESSMDNFNARTPPSTLGESTGNALNAYFGNKMRQAQTDNLYQQNEVLQQDAALKAAQTGKTLADTARSSFDLTQADRLKDLAYDQAMLNNQSTEIQNRQRTQAMEVELTRLEEYKLANAANVQKTYQDIISSRIQNAKTQQETKNLKVIHDNLKKDGIVKQFQAEMANEGVTTNDHIWFRQLTKFLSQNRPAKEFIIERKQEKDPLFRNTE